MSCIDACCRPSRRALLAAGAGAAALPGLALAADAPKAAPARAVIDVHHHLMPPAYLAAHRAEIEAIMPGFFHTLGWTPQWSLDHMDQNGGRASILSLSAPGVWFGNGADAPKMARITNDYGAGVVRDHPTRFGFFAALPWLNVDATLKEIEYAYDVLKVDGVGLITSYNGRYPGEAEFMPIWQELNRRKAVVYVHPTSPACCGATVKGLPPAGLEFPYDTTRTIASLLTGLVLSKNPDIKFIFSHGGGALPTLADRLSNVASVRPDIAAQYRGGALAELKRLNFDTASVTNPSAWAGLTKLVPTSQIFYGTDYPFGSFAQVSAQLRDIGVGGADLARISHGNAEALFPRLATSQASGR